MGSRNSVFQKKKKRKCATSTVERVEQKSRNEPPQSFDNRKRAIFDGRPRHSRCIENEGKYLLKARNGVAQSGTLSNLTPPRVLRWALAYSARQTKSRLSSESSWYQLSQWPSSCGWGDRQAIPGRQVACLGHRRQINGLRLEQNVISSKTRVKKRRS